MKLQESQKLHHKIIQLQTKEKYLEKDIYLQTSSQNNSATNEGEILRERYISPEKRQKIIDDPRLYNNII